MAIELISHQLWIGKAHDIWHVTAANDLLVNMKIPIISHHLVPICNSKHKVENIFTYDNDAAARMTQVHYCLKIIIMTFFNALACAPPATLVEFGEQLQIQIVESVVVNSMKYWWPILLDYPPRAAECSVSLGLLEVQSCCDADIYTYVYMWCRHQLIWIGDFTKACILWTRWLLS